jgi:hypothetical protein
MEGSAYGPVGCSPTSLVTVRSGRDCESTSARRYEEVRAIDETSKGVRRGPGPLPLNPSPSSSNANHSAQRVSVDIP